MEAKTTLRSVPTGEPDGDLDLYADRWRRHMRADNKRDRTITDYLRVIAYFDRWLTETGRSRFVADITKDDIEAFKSYWLEATHPDGTPYEPNTARLYTATLKSFFRWLAEGLDEGDGVRTNPAELVRLPKVPKKVMDIPDRTAIDAVMATTKGSSFPDRRDRAILGVLISSGTRESGVAGMRVDSVHIDERYPYITVELKGGDEHKAMLDRETVKDLDRYLALRRRHPHSSSPYLWLGPRGRMTSSGLYQMVTRRAEQAGVKVTVHDFRRFAASTLLARGSTIDDVMTTLGWADRTMPSRYAAATAFERAAATHERLNPRASEV
jgi:site-specific recombinase XerD